MDVYTILFEANWLVNSGHDIKFLGNRSLFRSNRFTVKSKKSLI